MLSSIVYTEAHPRRSAARAAFCTSSIPSNSFSRTPAPMQSAVPQNRSITPLESTLIEVLILGNLKLFRMNTYEKHGGRGAPRNSRPAANAPGSYGRVCARGGLNSMTLSCRSLALLIGIVVSAGFPCVAQQTSTPATTEGDFVAHDFKFRSAESLPELRLHYRTLGNPARDAQGHVTNAVLILHGTGGSGQQFLQPQFAGVLFGPGQLLDTTRYFIILPDGIGHGKSSKPSNGLHAHFPQYDYD